MNCKNCGVYDRIRTIYHDPADVHIFKKGRYVIVLQLGSKDLDAAVTFQMEVITSGSDEQFSTRADCTYVDVGFDFISNYMRGLR